MVTVRKIFYLFIFLLYKNDVLNCVLFFPCVYDVHGCAYSVFVNGHVHE